MNRHSVKNKQRSWNIPASKTLSKKSSFGSDRVETNKQTIRQRKVSNGVSRDDVEVEDSGDSDESFEDMSNSDSDDDADMNMDENSAYSSDSQQRSDNSSLGSPTSDDDRLEDGFSEDENEMSGNVEDSGIIDENGVEGHAKRKATESSANRREAKKLKTIERKQAKDSNYDTILSCKKIWSKLSNVIGSDQNDSQEKARLHIDELVRVFDGHIYECISKRDGSRVIQACLKHGTKGQRARIFEELLDQKKYSKTSLLELASSPYGKFVLWKLFKYAPEKNASAQLIHYFSPYFLTMARHRFACRVLDMMYTDYANGDEQRVIRESFYGPQFLLFRDKQKDKNQSLTLDVVFDKEPAKKPFILAFMMKALSPVVAKGTLQYVCFLHKTVLELLQHSSNDESLVSLRNRLRDQLVTILHTREGSQITIHCIEQYSVDDQTRVLVSMKPFIQKILEDEYGHFVVLKIFECLDVELDQVKSIVFQKYNLHSKELMLNKFARRIVVYLMSFNNLLQKQNYLGGPQAIKMLLPAVVVDENKRTRRFHELLSFLLEAIFEFFQENTRASILDQNQNDILAECICLNLNEFSDVLGKAELSALETSQKTLVKSTINALCDQEIESKPVDIKKIFKDPTKEKKPDSSADSEEVCLRENFVANRWTQRLIRLATTSEGAAYFVDAFLSIVERDFAQWATGKCSFVIVRLEELVKTKEKVKKLLKTHAAVLRKAATNGNAGAKILTEKLNE